MVAIRHFKDSKNITSVAITQTTKKVFMTYCYGTENMLARAAAPDDTFGIYDLVKNGNKNKDGQAYDLSIFISNARTRP